MKINILLNKLLWNIYREKVSLVLVFIVSLLLGVIAFVIQSEVPQKEFIYHLNWLVSNRYFLASAFFPVLLIAVIYPQKYDVTDIFAGFGRKLAIIETLLFTFMIQFIATITFMISISTLVMFQYSFTKAIHQMTPILLLTTSVYISNLLISFISLIIGKLLSSKLLAFIVSLFFIWLDFYLALLHKPNLFFSISSIGNIYYLLSTFSIKIGILLGLIWIYLETFLKKDLIE